MVSDITMYKDESITMVPDITMHKDESTTMVPDERMMLAWKPHRGPGQQSQDMSAIAAAVGTAGACSASDPFRAI